MMVLFLLLLISIPVIFFTNICNVLIVIPIGVIFALVVINSVLKERYLYKSDERARELIENEETYKEYISQIICLMITNGIDSQEKFDELKRECCHILDIHEKNHSRFNDRIFDVLLAVPLGAVIASVILSDSDISLESGLLIIVIWVSVFFLSKLYKWFQYYSYEHFKDKYLLNTLNELSYIPSVFSEAFHMSKRTTNANPSADAK